MSTAVLVAATYVAQVAGIGLFIVGLCMAVQQANRGGDE